MSHFSKTLLKFGVAIVFINMVGMWGLFYFEHQNIVKLQELNNLPSKKVGEVEKKTDPDTRLKFIENSQEQLVGKVEELESSVSEIDAELKDLPDPVVRSTNSAPTTAKKEYSIYLGEGSSFNREWSTIQSTTITIDTNKYPGLSAVYFESALSIVGGEAHAQLIEVNTGATISNTTLVNNTQSPTWKSQQVNLNSGSHTYAVQLRSSSGELATLSGARLRIMAD